MTKRKDPADFAQDSRSPFAMTGRICARRPGAAVRNGGSMKTELDSAWESAIHNAERARKAEAEVERLRAELICVCNLLVYLGRHAEDGKYCKICEVVARARKIAAARKAVGGTL